MSAEQVRLERVLEFAHHQLGLDAVYLWQFRHGRQECRAVAGDAASFRLYPDDGCPVQETYSHRMVTGQIPSLVSDTRRDRRVSGLPVTRESQIGAYVGVPVRCSAGTVWGTLVSVSHQPRPDLDERAVAMLSLLADLIIYDAEEHSGHEQLRRDVLEFIDTGGFAVAYQPVFELHSSRCIGLEALARFPDPYSRPDDTFAAAERVGLRAELEGVVVRRALELIPKLAPGQFLAVNVSPETLLDEGRRAVSVDPRSVARLVVEVTEHAAIAAYAALRHELRPLRERGLRIAVDDAGAGYASLRHILELRPDFIKLDRWLIDGLADDRARRVAVGSFVSLARELGASVIGEGVERAEDLAALRELGLHGAQGYLLGRPSTDPQQVEAWCAAGGPVHQPAVLGRSDADRPPPADAAGQRSGGAAAVRGATSPAVATAVGRELDRLELDRRVSQRLEAVGQLAAGIAHEINTPLQFVGDSVSFLRDAVHELVALTGLYRQALETETAIPLEQRRREMREAEERADVDYLCERIPAAFDRTADGIARVRSIVQAMKRFSHAAGTEVAPADINDALQTTLVVCRSEYKYVADVALELGPLPDVVCNIGELNQVFLNLIINAAHAIEEEIERGGERGEIAVSTHHHGASVVIEIADTGPGIPPALIDRIYEPFFTTKPPGRGTGQGLALALATIQRHAGSLKCTSTPGRGTTFTITLPLVVAGMQPAEAA
ncbi:MAG TPA: EAL domain-containing protein [Solirubrobacteraceae bacterium]|nr:EAL domain-containing protein [Solirubrobacteraceae bacterium]